MPQFIIEANRSWFRIPWREIAEYRDLLWLLVRRDFVAKYKQTILGPAWFIIQPLLMSLMFTVIFGRVANIPTDSLPPMLFYLCGMLAWQYFAQCLKTTSTTFVHNMHLFGKVYFPRLIVPLAVVISNMLAFFIQLITFACFWLYYKYFTAAGSLIQVRPSAVLLPLLFLQTAALGLGVGLWMSSLTAKFRDFIHLSEFLTQLWMYATPVVYPLSLLSEKWRWVSILNPMSSVVECYRLALLGSGVMTFRYMAVSALITAVLLLSGILLFNRVERTFIDTV
ncbi:MAG: ABC transporter permease [Kiritimatiellae bacterium]|nr:ABC transporter permease [Kiritimatiellia bacterium]